MVPLIFLILMFFLSSLAATMLCEAMALIPGNENYEKRVEFSTIVEHYYGHKAYIVTQCVYSLSLQTLNIASIIVTAQVMDQFLVRIVGKSYALALEHGSFVETTDLATPFAGAGLIISLGYMIVTVMCLPVGFLNLSEGIYFQYFSFAILLAGMVEFFAQYLQLDIKTDRVPVFGSDFSQVIGTILFNYTYVVTVPSWVNEKMEKVSVNKVIWVSGIFTTVGYFVMGYVGAIAYEKVASNVLTTFASGGHLGTEISAYIFSLGVIGLGIPLFSIMIRYNLYVGKVFGPKLSAFFGVVLPWLVSWPLYQGNGFGIFVSWASLLINSFINFGLPMVIYITARRRYAEHVNAGGSVGVPGAGAVAPAAAEPASARARLYSNSSATSGLMGSTAVNTEEAGLLYENPYDYFYSPVNALPAFLRRYKSSMALAKGLLSWVVVLTVAAIIFQFLTQLGVVSDSG